MKYCLIILMSSAIFCSSSDVDVVQEDKVKTVRAGEDVNITCTFSSDLMATAAWFKQTIDGKSLHIVSSYKNQPNWNKDFNQTKHFKVVRAENHFNLIILNADPSDSATYYCVISSYFMTGMGAGTRLLVRDAAADRRLTLRQSLIGVVGSGDSVDLQCSLFTESCAGAHSVHWFRQSSGDSEGLLYTTGERNAQCESSTESQTQSCVYSLHKSNISHSDAGIYYCAVAACGQILFGEGAPLTVTGSSVSPALLALGISNIVFLTLVVFLGIKQCMSQNKVPTAQESQSEDSMNYAAISFSRKPPNHRRAKVKLTLDQSVYAQVRSDQ